jgi:hypothetical protein
LNGGALKEKRQFDFIGLTFGDFITGAVGKYVEVPPAAGDSYRFWFNLGTETAPPDSPFIYIQVSVDPGGGLSDLATGLATAMAGEGYSTTGSTGNVVVAEDALTGARSDATAGTSGVTLTLITIGRAAATGGPAVILVPITNNLGGSFIADAMVTACDGQGWIVSNAANLVTFTTPPNHDFNLTKRTSRRHRRNAGGQQRREGRDAESDQGVCGC